MEDIIWDCDMVFFKIEFKCFFYKEECLEEWNYEVSSV